MKKITSLILALTVAASLFAQTAEDALLFSQEYYEGTARSMAMGNAFTALGGDLGGIAINPAGSGVYRTSQFSFTPSFVTSRTDASYLSNVNAFKTSGMALSNLGGVFTIDTGNYSGLLNWNFGVVYNRKNNFRSYMQVEGTTSNSSMLSAIASSVEGYDWHYLESSSNPFVNIDAPWPGILAWNTKVLAPLSYLGGKYENVEDSYIASTENYDEISDELQIGGPLHQRFNRKTYGNTGEISFNVGGNFSDFLYLGVNLNVNSVDQTVEEYYEEKADRSSDFQDGFVSMDNSFWLRTKGSGINFKVGAIVTPMAGLRLGATVTTPTWYDLTDEWDYTMNTAFNNGNSCTEYSPTGTYSYKMTAPMRWSIGAAYTFFDRGLFSVDYEGVNYSATRFSDVSGNSGYFDGENSYMAGSYRNAHILRLGAELWLGERMALRGGYQNYSPAVKGGASRNVYSAGLGFRLGRSTTLDLAWTKLGAVGETFQLYDNYSSAVTVPSGTRTSTMSKVVCTLAFKF
ncbi:MAG: outer membrane protein transport protein [Bacteroidales bacterium]|nr:outer membrane protein transport protein [Bacteroidales bacterium]